MFNSTEIDKPQKVIKGLHEQKINDLKWYGNLVITSSIDKKIRIIDPVRMETIHSIQLQERPLSMAKYGEMLLIACENGAIFHLSLNNQPKLSKLLTIGTERINTIDINRDGTLFAIGTSTGLCRVYDLKTLKLIRTLNGHKAGINKVAFSPINNFIATACLDKTVRLFHTMDASQQPVLFRDHYSWVLDVKFSPDGKTLISSGKDKLVVLYLIDQNKLVSILEERVGRNFTKEEWNNYVNKEVEYEKTIDKY